MRAPGPNAFPAWGRRTPGKCKSERERRVVVGGGGQTRIRRVKKIGKKIGFLGAGSGSPHIAYCPVREVGSVRNTPTHKLYAPQWRGREVRYPYPGRNRGRGRRTTLSPRASRGLRAPGSKRPTGRWGSEGGPGAEGTPSRGAPGTRGPTGRTEEGARGRPPRASRTPIGRPSPGASGHGLWAYLVPWWGCTW
jgi:hypothetical protein